MPKYVRRTTDVEAWRFFLKDIGDCPEWVKHSDVRVLPPIGESWKGITYIEIHSVLGTLNAFEGDYIVKNENGEVYVVDSRVFDLYYEKRESPLPFSLERALAGEPVKLRNGIKAYILHDLRHLYSMIIDKRCLIGVYAKEEDCNALCGSIRWKCDGRYYENIRESEFDIVAMWEDNEGANND